LFRSGRIRLLPESETAEKPGFAGRFQLFAAPDIAVGGGRFGRFHSDGADPVRVFRHESAEVGEHQNQVARPLDQMVGGEQAHHRILSAARLDDPGRKRGTRGGVAGNRFADHVFRRKKRHQLAHRVNIIPVGDDQNMIHRKHRAQPLHGQLDHRCVAEKTQKLLGAAAPALRPETFALSSRHDDGIGIARHRLKFLSGMTFSSSSR